MDGLDAMVERELARWGVPGLVLGVLRDGEAGLRAYGVASRATGERVTPETVFRIASLTKPVTATLAAGLLPLDEPVAELPGVVLGDLLAHAAGLECELPHWLGRHGDGDGALEAAVAELHLARRLVPPGELWSYANTGYWLAGAIAARAAGATYEAALRERVLEPLGMDSTACSAAEVSGPLADGHRGERAVPPGGYPRARVPSGGLLSTAGDLLRFAADQFDRRPLHEPRIDAIGPRRWSAGFAVEGEMLLHSGSYGGYQSELAIVPGRRFAVTVLTNAANGAAAYRPIVDHVLAGELGLHRPEPQPVELDGLDRFTGVYRQSNVEAEVSLSGGGLVVRERTHDLATGEWSADPPLLGVPVGPRDFAVLEGEARGVRFDFPGSRWARIRSMLCERV